MNVNENDCLGIFGFDFSLRLSAEFNLWFCISFRSYGPVNVSYVNHCRDQIYGSVINHIEIHKMNRECYFRPLSFVFDLVRCGHAVWLIYIRIFLSPITYKWLLFRWPMEVNEIHTLCFHTSCLSYSIQIYKKTEIRITTTTTDGNLIVAI